MTQVRAHGDVGEEKNVQLNQLSKVHVEKKKNPMIWYHETALLYEHKGAKNNRK